MSTDFLGTWSDFGQITMTDDWQYFPIPGVGSTAILRITYGGDWKRRHGLVRVNYTETIETNCVSQALAVYPKPEKQIVKLEVPVFPVVFYLQAKQVYRSFRDTYVTAEDGQWTMKVEQWEY